MAFEKKVPQWNAPGTEPPESLRNTGFQPEYKPPADYFNWFWYSVAQCLMELQGMNPSDIGAFPADGSKPMTGTLFFQKVNNNGSARIHKNHNATSDYGLVLHDSDASGKTVMLRLQAADNTMEFIGNDNTYARTIFHTGNKPSGSYTGNGSATSRTIDIGGIGNCLLVWGDAGFALVSPNGAFYYNAVGSNILGLGSATFTGGKLTMATSEKTVNGSGITYNYQVL